MEKYQRYSTDTGLISSMYITALCALCLFKSVRINQFMERGQPVTSLHQGACGM